MEGKTFFGNMTAEDLLAEIESIGLTATILELQESNSSLFEEELYEFFNRVYNEPRGTHYSELERTLLGLIWLGWTKRDSDYVKTVFLTGVDTNLLWAHGLPFAFEEYKPTKTRGFGFELLPADNFLIGFAKFKQNASGECLVKVQEELAAAQEKFKSHFNIDKWFEKFF